MSTRLSRRRFLERAAIVLGAAAASGVAAPARPAEELGDADKITHAAAQYQLVPKGQQRCEICLQFEPPNRCKIVRSPIYPKGWCQYFAARENAH